MKKDIKILKIEPCSDSLYIRPHRVFYTENGVAKNWDIIQAHDSVSILIYDTSQKAIIIVNQMRPALFLKDNIDCAYELCAGIVDKDKSLCEIAKEEVLEECGYNISTDSLHKICSFYSSVGFTATKQTFYYTEVNDTMKATQGGGIDDEQIEVVAIPLNDIRSFLYDERYAKTSGLLFALMWFLSEKSHHMN